MTAAKRDVCLGILRQMRMDEDASFLRYGFELLTQRLIELETMERIGAERFERRS